MRIPPIFSALRRRTRLMADYAAAGRCVRIAARGFSPEAAHGMPERKSRRSQHFYFMLEARRLKQPEKQKAAVQKVPQADFTAKTKEKGQKSRINENDLGETLFPIAF